MNIPGYKPALQLGRIANPPQRTANIQKNERIITYSLQKNERKYVHLLHFYEHVSTFHGATNIHPNSQKVRRTVRLQTGVQPPFIIVTKQSPEGATDRQQGIACHPFRVLFNQYHLCRDLHPCLCSAVPVGDLMGK